MLIVTTVMNAPTSATATATGRGTATSIPHPSQPPRASHARPRPRPQLDAPHGARTSRGQLAGAFVPGQSYTEAASETPLYAELVASWTASAATVPGIPDSEWQRLTSYQSFLREVESVLRDLRPHRAPDMLRG